MHGLTPGLELLFALVFNLPAVLAVIAILLDAATTVWLLKRPGFYESNGIMARIIKWGTGKGLKLSTTVWLTRPVAVGVTLWAYYDGMPFEWQLGVAGFWWLVVLNNARLIYKEKKATSAA